MTEPLTPDQVNDILGDVAEFSVADVIACDNAETVKLAAKAFEGFQKSLQPFLCYPCAGCGSELKGHHEPDCSLRAR